MHCICCVISDLIFTTKIRSTAEAVGVEVQFARSMPKLLDKLSDKTDLLIIDLNLQGDDPLEIIRAIRRIDEQPKILAFLSHVQTELAVQAREAGADTILARSQFSATLPQILQGQLPETNLL